MNKHKSNKIKENSNTVRHLIMGQIITTQNLVATKVVRLAGQLGTWNIMWAYRAAAGGQTDKWWMIPTRRDGVESKICKKNPQKTNKKTNTEHSSIDHDDTNYGWLHETSSNGNIFSRYWPFVRGIHRSLANSPHKGQWRGALIFSLICVWINGRVINDDAGDLRRYRAHYDIIAMEYLANDFSSVPFDDNASSDIVSQCILNTSVMAS